MIVAYAQAADRQGLNAAVYGRLVAPDEASFAELREKAVSLNFATTPSRVGDVEVRYGKGLMRLEFKGTDTGSATSSPIIVVTDAAEVLHNRENAVRRVMESVAAIGRQCDAQVIEAGFAVGERLQRSIRTKRRVATAVSTALITVALVWLVRSCATSENIFTSAGSWSR